MTDGLLFHLTGSREGTAEAACGEAAPLFYQGIETIEDPVMGKALLVGRENSRFSHRAPGNLYAQRGTLCFFWRSIYPLGPTEFPIYRVSYADHTSWDTTWLRIDYNGWGFDAFVTDTNLSRVRVSYALQPMPKPDVWTHIAFAWDECSGVRLFVNGILVRERETKAVFDAGLDSFGPGGRLISYWGSQNRYNFIREGGLCDLRVYGHMLGESEVRSLARREEAGAHTPQPGRGPRMRKFAQRYGFTGARPPVARERLCVKKLMITDPFDHKRWSWKVTDGIRETTWPGVYNRSGLDGRTDYIVLPDWDCYSVSGERLTLTAPAGANYLEVTGGAWGGFSSAGKELFRRGRGQEKSFYSGEISGLSLTFTNEMKEQPLSDISAYRLDTGDFPEPSRRYRIGGYTENDAARELAGFIKRRFVPAERSMLLATPEREGDTLPPAAGLETEDALPFAHILLPFEQMGGAGLDGLILELPAIHTAPTHGEYLLLNLQVKDPIWYYRNMLEITLAVLPHEPVSLWLDLRDRVLRERGCLYLTVAASSPDFHAGMLGGAGLHIVTKPFGEAKGEHVADRFLQVRDHFSNMVEERPKTTEFNAFNRFFADITDLLRVDPQHQRAREYYYLHLGGEKPPVRLPECPPDIPEWVFWQTQYLKHLKLVVNWWIDQRQLANGEFGGGLSDDGDLTAIWPSLILLGCGPDKVKESLERQMEAFYEQDMFSSGLCKIQTDQLHTLEDGVQVIGQCLTVAPSDPRHLERAMENARAMWRLTGINAAGHRHFYSAYYSGHKIALERPWNFQNSDTLNILHPSYLLARYNGNKQLKGLLVELADSLLAHYRDGRVYSSILFDTDEDAYLDNAGSGHSLQEDFLFKAAYELTGDGKYLAPAGERIHWKPSGTPEPELAAYYKQALEDMLLLEYINTDGQVWSDRVQLEYGRIQQDRLGGVGHVRFDFYPRHFLSWRFAAPATDESVGVRMLKADTRSAEFIVYNKESYPVTAQLTGGEILPGRWRLEQDSQSSEVSFGREEELPVTFPPQSSSAIALTLLEEAAPYHSRPDLGIGRGDARLTANGAEVTVHSLGSVPAPPVPVVLRNPAGEITAVAMTKPMPAPEWLFPVTSVVLLQAPGAGAGWQIEIDPESTLCEISRKNNKLTL